MIVAQCISLLAFLFMFYLFVRAVRVLLIPFFVKIEYTYTSEQDVPLPKSAFPCASRLTQWGFVPFEVVHARVLNMQASSWRYINESRTVVATIAFTSARRPSSCALETYLESGALVVTSFPKGRTIREPDLHMSYAIRDLENAFNYHHTQIEAWQSAHGMPIQFATPEVYRKVVEDVYGHRYRSRFQRSNKRIMFTMLVLLTAFVGAVVYDMLRPDNVALPIILMVGELVGLAVVLLSRRRNAIDR